jgi:hypothetical protein
VALGNIIDSFIRRITIRRKNSQAPDKSNSSSIISNSKGKRFIVLGIIIAMIGFAGTIFYGSQFVIPSHIKSALPMDLEIVFVVIAVIGFGILTYGLVSKVDKPLDSYPPSTTNR